MFRAGKRGQDGLAVAVAVITPSSVEDTLTILAQHDEAACPAGSE
jgi:hypothetical protein